VNTKEQMPLPKTDFSSFVYVHVYINIYIYPVVDLLGHKKLYVCIYTYR
jgi:hypothetical protein